MPKKNAYSHYNGQSTLSLPDASITYINNFFQSDEADNLFFKLNEEIDWRIDEILMFGKVYAIPRKQAFYGNEGLSYTYSGISNTALPWIQALRSIRSKLLRELDLEFNSVLCNLYRNGEDSNGWHADDEVELGENPLIGSVSFGEARDFQLKHKTSGQRHSIKLEHGSLLIMAGETQKNWLHCLPKRKRCKAARINLTFRTITQP